MLVPIKKGDVVKVEYTGTLEDGSVFDSSDKYGRPLEFEAGSGQVIKGFDEAVIGMEKGQEKEIKLQPLQAYGHYNPELVQKVPREVIPEGEEEPQPGMVLMAKLPTGQQIPAKITGVSDKEITIDLNHPLAGRTLIFKFKIVDAAGS